MLELISFRSDWALWPLADRSEFPAPARAHSVFATMLTAPWRLAKTIGAELAARRAMQTLASLDDRMLRDIGIERSQIWHASRHGREALAQSSDLRADLTRWA